METLIEGLTKITGPVFNNIRGRLTLPDTFDSGRFSAKWVEEGHEVEAAKQPEIISSVGMQAQGWSVWTPALQASLTKTGEKLENKPYVHPLRSCKLILMCRPKTLQQEVNKLYGKISNTRVTSETQYGSAAKTEFNDNAGILSDIDLPKERNEIG